MKILTKDELASELKALCGGYIAEEVRDDEIKLALNSHEDLRELLRRLWEYLPWHLQDAIELDNPELWEAVMEAIGDVS